MADAAVVAVKVTAVEIELPSHADRVQYLNDWEEATRENRKEARRDRDYVDNHQHAQEEIEILRRRKQPVLTKNRIARKVNYVVGEEIKRRVDPAARPRHPQHEDSAQAATDALRYVEEQQKFDNVRSWVFKNMVIEGIGSAIVEVKQEDGEVKFGLRHVNWDRFAYDQHSRAPDFSDAKWLAIIVWMDLEDAILRWPDKAQKLNSAMRTAVMSTDKTTEDAPRKWIDGKRKRVKIVEMYLEVAKNWFKSVFTESTDLEDPAKTEYLNEKRTKSLCPLKAASCYVDAEGNRYGVVRQMISPQDEVNKRASKNLHRLSVKGILAEKQVVEDPKKLREELAKPDCYYDGFAAEALKNGSVHFIDPIALEQAEFQLMQEAKTDIDQIGPSAATIPDLPASSSGRAFIARQKAASQELGEPFDNLSNWTLSIFGFNWCCIRLWWTDEMWLRVDDDKELSGFRFTAINQKVTRAQRFMQLMQLPEPPPVQQALEIAAGTYAGFVLSESQNVQKRAAAILQQLEQAAQSGAPISPQQQQALAALQQTQTDEYLASVIVQHPLMQQVITLNQVDQMMMDIIIDEAPETTILADEQFDTLAELFPSAIQTRPDLAPMMLKSIFQASRLPNKRNIMREFDKGPDQQQVEMQQQMQTMQIQLQKVGLIVEQTKAQLFQAQAEKASIEARLLPAKAQADITSKNAESASWVEMTKADIEHKTAQAAVHAVNAGFKLGHGG